MEHANHLRLMELLGAGLMASTILDLDDIPSRTRSLIVFATCLVTLVGLWAS